MMSHGNIQLLKYALFSIKMSLIFKFLSFSSHLYLAEIDFHTCCSIKGRMVLGSKVPSIDWLDYETLLIIRARSYLKSILNLKK